MARLENGSFTLEYFCIETHKNATFICDKSGKWIGEVIDCQIKTPQEEYSMKNFDNLLKENDIIKNDVEIELKKTTDVSIDKNVYLDDENGKSYTCVKRCLNTKIFDMIYLGAT